MTKTKQTLKELMNIQPSIKFTIEKEKHKEINYLDIKIHCKEKRLEFSIYRTPTQTDIIIPNSSCHPHEHKLSGIKYQLNRLHISNNKEIKTDRKKRYKKYTAEK
jgi:hypothetical protein